MLIHFSHCSFIYHHFYHFFPFSVLFPNSHLVFISVFEFFFSSPMMLCFFPINSHFEINVMDQVSELQFEFVVDVQSLSKSPLYNTTLHYFPIFFNYFQRCCCCFTPSVLLVLYAKCYCILTSGGCGFFLTFIFHHSFVFFF